MARRKPRNKRKKYQTGRRVMSPEQQAEMARREAANKRKQEEIKASQPRSPEPVTSTVTREPPVAMKSVPKIPPPAAVPFVQNVTTGSPAMGSGRQRRVDTSTLNPDDYATVDREDRLQEIMDTQGVTREEAITNQSLSLQKATQTKTALLQIKSLRLYETLAY